MPECRKARFCKTRDPAGRPGPAGPRGLCIPCENDGVDVLYRLPHDYVSLWMELSPAGGGTGSPIPNRRVDAPAPLRLDVEAQLRCIHWVLMEWFLPVRRSLGFGGVVVKGTRHGTAVNYTAMFLATHYSALLALPQTRYRSYDTGMMEWDDGPGAVVQLTAVHHATLALLGENRVWEGRFMPCPGCKRYELGTWLGSGAILCAHCHWECTIGDYEKYVLTSVPPGRKN